MRPKLFLIDAMGLIFRAYYAMIKSPRYTTKGLNTSAILGFTNMFYELVKNEKPTHIAVAFDTGAPTFRHAEFEEYKANREATPDDIINAVPYIKRILEAFRVPIVEMDGYEADDVVGTLAKHAEIEGFDVYMMTSDKDYGQLVSPNIKMYKPGKMGQPAEILGPEEICQKYGIKRPEQLIDILGLQGDSSDNIPGVPGVGPVSAKKLLANYDSIENMYACGINLDKEKQRQHLLEYKEQALLSKQLATIMIDVPITCDFEKMAYLGPDPAKLKAVFTELEFNALSQRIFRDLSLKPAAPAEVDLFSQPQETDGVGESAPERVKILPKVVCVESPEDVPEMQQPADEEKISSPYDGAPLYFDWIRQEERIAGFVFALDAECCRYHFVESEHRHYQSLLRWIFTGDRVVVMHDSKSTYKYLKAFKIDPTVAIFDLQIAHYLIQPETKHELDRLVAGYLGCQLSGDASELQTQAVERVSSFVQLYPLLRKELQDNSLIT
ncbi:MAG: DNA polymerase I, partial [Bacteroidales bacterium]|nr:DNA polymerase I [Bacteroidales bacterium]